MKKKAFVRMTLEAILNVVRKSELSKLSNDCLEGFDFEDNRYKRSFEREHRKLVKNRKRAVGFVDDFSSVPSYSKILIPLVNSYVDYFDAALNLEIDDRLSEKLADEIVGWLTEGKQLQSFEKSYEKDYNDKEIEYFNLPFLKDKKHPDLSDLAESNSRLEAELAKKDLELSERDQTIESLEKEIAKLKDSNRQKIRKVVQTSSGFDQKPELRTVEAASLPTSMILPERERGSFLYQVFPPETYSVGEEVFVVEFPKLEDLEHIPLWIDRDDNYSGNKSMKDFFIDYYWGRRKGFSRISHLTLPLLRKHDSTLAKNFPKEFLGLLYNQTNIPIIEIRNLTIQFNPFPYSIRSIYNIYQKLINICKKNPEVLTKKTNNIS